MMQERSRITKKERIVTARSRLPVTFYCFDILRHNQYDLRSLPLEKRKSILSSVFTKGNHFSDVMFIEGRGIDLFDIIKSRGMEGVVAKRLGSTYVNSRSKSWLKIINWTYVDVFITGYRKREFGWLASDEQGRPLGVIDWE